MVYTKINVVYGFLVKVDQVRNYLASLGLHDLNQPVDDDTEYEIYYDLSRHKYFKRLGVKIFHFPCCSEKNLTHYMIGVSLGDYSPSEILEGDAIITKLTEEIKNTVISLPDELKDGTPIQIMMLDDCTFCS